MRFAQLLDLGRGLRIGAGVFCEIAQELLKRCIAGGQVLIKVCKAFSLIWSQALLIREFSPLGAERYSLSPISR